MWNADRALAWSSAAPPPSPAGAGAELAADPVGSEAVLFGGLSGSTLSSSTDVYNETTNRWTTDLTSPSYPSPSSDFAFAGDSVLRTAVLFGGVVDASTLRVDNSTWTYGFATGDWTNVSKAIAPSPREASAFAVDPSGGIGLLYGGWNQDYSPASVVVYSDLWEFSLSTATWSPVAVAPGPAPPPLEGAMLSWDPVANRFDLFGGCYPCSSTVWQFNPSGNTWNELPPPSGIVPAARAPGSWSWDPSDSVDVLFGGTNGVSLFNDSYEFFPLGDRWVPQSTPVAPSPRATPASAWLNESGNQTLLLAGGNGTATFAPDLWRLAPTSNLTVVVRNSSDGDPIVAANVSVDETTAIPTGGEGYLNLTELTPAVTSVNVTCLGYAYSESVGWIAPAASEVLEFHLSPVPPASLSVTVTDPSGFLLWGVSVRVTVDGTAAPGSPKNTSYFGNADFPSVPSEIPIPKAVVQASAPEYYTNSTSVAIPPGSVESVELTLVPYPVLAINVVGTLANLATVPLHNASVVEDGHHLGLTDAEGWLNVTTTTPGTVNLLVSAAGFDTKSQAVALPTTGLDVVTVDLTGKPFGTLQVQVDEEETGKPVGGAFLNASSVLGLSSAPYEDVDATNGTGGATFQLPQDVYDVNATAYGYRPGGADDVVVLPNETAAVTIFLTLLPGADVDVLVHDAHTAAPLSLAPVQIASVQPGVSDGLGWANFTNVHFGLAFITVSHPGYYNNTTQVLLIPEEVLPRFVVNLTPGAGASGPGNGSISGLGDFPPPLGSLWPYLLAFGVTLVGSAAYVFFLRSARSSGNPPPREAVPPSSPPSELGRDLTPPP